MRSERGRTVLARNFRTPAELGHTEAEFEALVAVLEMFEREEVVYEPNPEDPSRPNGFNIGLTDCETERGTCCDIVGWARRRCPDCFMYFSPHTAFGRLVMPLGWLTNNRDYTVQRAAAAIRNYLAFGEARWGDILSGR
jgi:hypothetical protein